MKSNLIPNKRDILPLKNSGYRYSGLHALIRRTLAKPDKCKCGSGERMVVSNKSGQYNLDISDWEWLCYSCHSRKDKFGGYNFRKSWGRKHNPETIVKMRTISLKYNRDTTGRFA